MTEPEIPHPPKASIDEVLEEFDRKKDLLSSLCTTTQSLIEELLRHEKIRYQSVQCRVKSRDKLRTKYSSPQKNYLALNDITDQAAVRVITYYEDEAELVAGMIEQQFCVDRDRSVDKRATEPNKFGYYALNYICKYSQDRASLSEYKKFADVWFEIQITSVLRHAWSEMEHPWYDLRGAFPADIQRRFARMAALLEVAESEFMSLKKIQADYQRSVEVLVEAKDLTMRVDALSMAPFLKQDPLVKEIDKNLASMMGLTISPELPDFIVESRSRTATLAGVKTLQELRDLLRKHKAAIPSFAGACLQVLWPSSSPGSEVYPGVCVYYLGLILVGIQGVDATLDFLVRLGLTPKWDLSRQVAIARDAVRKYSE